MTRDPKNSHMPRYRYTRVIPKEYATDGLERIEYVGGVIGHRLGYVKRRDIVSHDIAYCAVCICGWKDDYWVPKKALHRRYGMAHLPKVLDQYTFDI